MNAGPIVFLATFLAMSVSWLGFVLAPQLQLGNQPQVADMDGRQYPSMRPGMARQGEQVYRANGCFYCHTEQVRPRGFGSDVERGWGGRPGVVQSVDEDYLFDQPAMLGSQRIGPDLANIGIRQTNAAALLLHLYNPQLTMPKSVMPSFKYLFEPLKPGKTPPADALHIRSETGTDEVMVPTDEARQLAAYLLSLHSDPVIFETPPPLTNAPAASATNAPAKMGTAATNMAATNSGSK